MDDVADGTVEKMVAATLRGLVQTICGKISVIVMFGGRGLSP